MDLKPFTVQRENRTAVFHGSWFRGEHTNFIPSKPDLRDADAFDKFVMPGWAPPAPFIDRSTPMTAFGSCFAANITNHLVERGYSVFGRHLDMQAHIIRFGEGMVNSFAVRQQLEWALTDRSFPENLWIDSKKEVASRDQTIRDETRAIICQTRVFIITLGLSEIWYHKPTGEAFWRAIPSALFDPELHGFRTTTVDENRDNIAACLDLIRGARPDATVILTLSPVPLMATFRPISCVTANAISKATLRLAIEQIIQEGRPQVFYYPAYEMITAATFDPFEEDNRHPKAAAIAQVMSTFEKHYCLPQ